MAQPASPPSNPDSPGEQLAVDHDTHVLSPSRKKRRTAKQSEDAANDPVTHKTLSAPAPPQTLRSHSEESGIPASSQATDFSRGPNLRSGQNPASTPKVHESTPKNSLPTATQPDSYPSRRPPFTLPSSFLLSVPPGIPRHPPASVLDLWHHGQLVWWNRFLANRKRSQGTGIGNFIGRVVDLDSEWLPYSSDLPQIKIRLKNSAAAMGRRSMVVQGLADMRYLTLPPRAVSPFPDMDAARQKELLVGLQTAGSLIAQRGLVLATMLEELRAGLNGEINSLTEILFLDICMSYQAESYSRVFTEQDLSRLKSTSVWDVLEHGKLDFQSSQGPPMSGAMLSGPPSYPTPKFKDKEDHETHFLAGGAGSRHLMATIGTGGRFQKRSPTDRFKAGSSSSNRRKPTSRPVTSVSNGSRSRAASSPHAFVSSQQALTHCKQLCRALCLKRSELLFLLEGAPLTLLASSTGLSLPEELPSHCLKLLELLHVSDDLASATSPTKSCGDVGPQAHHRLLGMHYMIANTFLYKLFHTVMLRVRVKKDSATSSTSALSPPSDPDKLRSSLDSSLPQFKLVLSLDHFHQDPAHIPLGSSKQFLPKPSLYSLPFSFSCVSAHRILWKPLAHLPISNCSEPYQSLVKCRQMSLRILAYGLLDDDQNLGYYCAEVHQISNHDVTDAEVEALSAAILSGKAKINMRELEKRLEELNSLREVSTYLKSIYDDILTTLRQTSGVLTAEDGRYFESLWLDIYRKLK